VLAILQDADGVLRAKGIVRFADAPDRRSVIHLVGRRLDVSDGGPWGDSDPSRLVLVGPKSMSLHASLTGILERKSRLGP
jgi:G3E family GTPase